MASSLGSLILEIRADISQLEQRLKSIEDLARRIGTNSGQNLTDNLRSALAAGATQAKKTLAEKILDGIWTGVGITIGQQILTGITGIFQKVISIPINFATDSLNKYEQFQANVLQFQKVTGAKPSETMAFEQEALRIGATTSQSSIDTSSAGTDLAKQGFTPEEVTRALAPMVSLAIASGEKNGDVVGRTQEVFLSVLSTFSKQFSRDLDGFTLVADKIAKFMNVGGVDLEGFKYGLANAGSIAVSYNQTFEQLAAFLTALKEGNISADSGGTAFKNIISRLGNPDDNTKAALKELSAANNGQELVVRNQDGTMRQLSEILKDLKALTDNLRPDRRDSILQTIAGMEGLPGLTTALQKIDKIEEFLKQTTNDQVKGYAGQQSGLGGIGASKEQLSGSIETLGINFAKAFAPGVEAVTNFLGQIIESISNTKDLFKGITDATQQFTKYLEENSDVAKELGQIFSVAIKDGLTAVSEIAKELLKSLKDNPLLIQDMVNGLKDFVQVLSIAIQKTTELAKGLIDAAEGLKLLSQGGGGVEGSRNFVKNNLGKKELEEFDKELKSRIDTKAQNLNPGETVDPEKIAQDLAQEQVSNKGLKNKTYLEKESTQKIYRDPLRRVELTPTVQDQRTEIKTRLGTSEAVVAFDQEFDKRARKFASSNYTPPLESSDKKWQDEIAIKLRQEIISDPKKFMPAENKDYGLAAASRQAVDDKSKAQYSPPTQGPITSEFGMRTMNGKKEFHPGIDFGAPEGTPVVAPIDSTVKAIGNDKKGFGNYVILRDAQGVESIYGHLKDKSIAVKEGQTLRQGEQIAQVGDTGRSTGPHLHFGIYPGGYSNNEKMSVDPQQYLGKNYTALATPQQTTTPQPTPTQANQSTPQPTTTATPVASPEVDAMLSKQEKNAVRAQEDLDYQTKAAQTTSPIKSQLLQLERQKTEIERRYEDEIAALQTQIDNQPTTSTSLEDVTTLVKQLDQTYVDQSKLGVYNPNLSADKQAERSKNWEAIDAKREEIEKILAEKFKGKELEIATLIRMIADLPSRSEEEIKTSTGKTKDEFLGELMKQRDEILGNTQQPTLDATQLRIEKQQLDAEIKDKNKSLDQYQGITPPTDYSLKETERLQKEIAQLQQQQKELSQKISEAEKQPNGTGLTPEQVKRTQNLIDQANSRKQQELDLLNTNKRKTLESTTEILDQQTQQTLSAIPLSADTKPEELLKNQLTQLESSYDELSKRLNELKNAYEAVKNAQQELGVNSDQLAKTNQNLAAINEALTTTEANKQKAIEETTEQFKRQQEAIAFNERLSRESLRSQIDNQKADVMERQGDLFGARRLRGQATERDTLINRDQDLRNLKSRYNFKTDDPGFKEEQLLILEKYNNQLDQVKGNFSDLALLIDPVQQGFETMFRDVITGSKDFGSAIRDFFLGILQTISEMATKIASQQIVSWLFGGLFGGGGGGSSIGGFGSFIGGLAGSFAEGGEVGKSTLYPISQALQREGPNAILAALTPGEQVLNIKEASLYRNLFPDGLTEKAISNVQNFATGGIVGNLKNAIQQTNLSNPQNNSKKIISSNVTINVATPDANSFKKSQGQIARDTALIQQKALRRNT